MKDIEQKKRLTIKKEITPQKDFDTPYKYYNYKYSDTGYFDIGIGDGEYVILKKNNILVDTIDLGYGIRQVKGDKFLYYTIIGNGEAETNNKNPKYKKSINASLGSYIVINSKQKELMHKIVPDFDDYFSSPSVINHKIYYWQIRQIDSTGKIKVSAAEFDPLTKTIKSHYIMEDILETDDNGYYPLPYIINDTIHFDANSKKLMMYSKDFKPYNNVRY